MDDAGKEFTLDIVLTLISGVIFVPQNRWQEVDEALVYIIGREIIKEEAPLARSKVSRWICEIHPELPKEDSAIFMAVSPFNVDSILDQMLNTFGPVRKLKPLPPERKLPDISLRDNPMYRLSKFLTSHTRH